MHRVELVTWMKQVHAKNTNKNYYTMGVVLSRKDTLAVTPVGGNGGAMFYCQPHQFAYEIKGQCAECQTAVLE